MRVRFKKEELHLLIETRAEFSCIRRDVLEQLARSGEKVFEACSPSCRLANGLGCDIR